ncbi:hypothetical protein Q5762_30845 [Streptomyces sp. P9(2023)]|uniref:hypothetical protein n=1 Tax=Streptomyces sp. P9(2023) TaxID=3064394 RepID=UPI0028F45ADA|nr:hypothetical protein [Streptomyces sp. P9(2023)]MDT9692652.1 hypothetical protein [Streptomyces sp. P9(2023)]
MVGLAVDGKVIRGSRHDDPAAVHPLAAVLHEGQGAIAQRQITRKSNEIELPAPLAGLMPELAALRATDTAHDVTHGLGWTTINVPQPHARKADGKAARQSRNRPPCREPSEADSRPGQTRRSQPRR